MSARKPIEEKRKTRQAANNRWKERNPELWRYRHNLYKKITYQKRKNGLGEYHPLIQEYRTSIRNTLLVFNEVAYG